MIQEERKHSLPVVFCTECDHPGDEERVGPHLAPAAVPRPSHVAAGNWDGVGYDLFRRVTRAGAVNQAAGACVMLLLIFNKVVWLIGCWAVLPPLACLAV